MNSAQLVNLILEKLRRVEFLAINQDGNGFFGVHFIWGFNSYAAIPARDGYVRVYQLPNHSESSIYTERIEGILNGMVRNDAGELVPCEN
jgi:hypothetical protein